MIVVLVLIFRIPHVKGVFNRHYSVTHRNGGVFRYDLSEEYTDRDIKQAHVALSGENKGSDTTHILSMDMKVFDQPLGVIENSKCTFLILNGYIL